jgi:hypothetical protein
LDGEEGFGGGSVESQKNPAPGRGGLMEGTIGKHGRRRGGGGEFFVEGDAPRGGEVRGEIRRAEPGSGVEEGKLQGLVPETGGSTGRASGMDDGACGDGGEKDA